MRDMNSCRLFDEDVTIEEVLDAYANGWELEINDGKVVKARLVVKESTYEGFKGVIFW